MGAQAKKTASAPKFGWGHPNPPSDTYLFLGLGLGTQKVVSAVFLQARARRPLPSFGQRPCRDRRGGAGSARPTEARWRRSELPDGSSGPTRGSSLPPARLARFLPSSGPGRCSGSSLEAWWCGSSLPSTPRHHSRPVARTS
jgi:hypothetical protein